MVGEEEWRERRDGDGFLKKVSTSGSATLPMLLRELPLEGEIWSRRGSMKGVKDEEDLCLDMELLSDWDWRTRERF